MLFVLLCNKSISEDSKFSTIFMQNVLNNGANAVMGNWC